jgi:hypothetical protein
MKKSLVIVLLAVALIVNIAKPQVVEMLAERKANALVGTCLALKVSPEQTVQIKVLEFKDQTFAMVAQIEVIPGGFMPMTLAAGRNDILRDLDTGKLTAVPCAE